MLVHSRVKPVSHATFSRLVHDTVARIAPCRLGCDPARFAQAYAGSALPRYASGRGTQAMNAAFAVWIDLHDENLSMQECEVCEEIYTVQRSAYTRSRILDFLARLDVAQHTTSVGVPA